MSYKEIANLIPTMQSLNLVSHNVEVAKKEKKDIKDVLDIGVTNIVGTSLIKTQADLIGNL